MNSLPLVSHYRCTIYRPGTGQERRLEFATLEDAFHFAEEVRQKTGIFLGIEEVANDQAQFER